MPQYPKLNLPGNCNSLKEPSVGYYIKLQACLSQYFFLHPPASEMKEVLSSRLPPVLSVKGTNKHSAIACKQDVLTATRAPQSSEDRKDNNTVTVSLRKFL